MRSVGQVATVVGVFALLACLPLHASGSPCTISGPGYSPCVGLVTFSSYVVEGAFKPFQAVYGAGVQPNVTITFTSPYARSITVWTNDPDYTNNRANYYFYPGAGPITVLAQGDGQPGVFSVSGRNIKNGYFTKVILQSDPSDYVNWRVEYQSQSQFGTNSWCRITAPQMTCGGVTVAVSPWYQGSNFDPFQSVSGTGYQVPIDVTFATPQLTVAATAVDPDYAGNRMEAYAADDTLLGSVSFVGDNLPGVTTTDTQSITSIYGIKRIRLIPDPLDYVNFQGITVTPF